MKGCFAEDFDKSRLIQLANKPVTLEPAEPVELPTEPVHFDPLPVGHFYGYPEKPASEVEDDGDLIERITEGKQKKTPQK